MVGKKADDVEDVLDHVINGTATDIFMKICRSSYDLQKAKQDLKDQNRRAGRGRSTMVGKMIANEVIKLIDIDATEDPSALAQHLLSHIS